MGLIEYLLFLYARRRSLKFFIADVHKIHTTPIDLQNSSLIGDSLPNLVILSFMQVPVRYISPHWAEKNIEIAMSTSLSVVYYCELLNV